jgi:hypothetical protein
MPQRPAGLPTPSIEAWTVERDLVCTHLAEVAGLLEQCAGPGEYSRAALQRWAALAERYIAEHADSPWMRAAMRGWQGASALDATIRTDQISMPCIIDLAWRLGCTDRVVAALVSIHQRGRRPDSSDLRRTKAEATT